MPPIPPIVAHGGRPDELVAQILLGTAIVAGWVGVSRVRGKRFAGMPIAVGWVLVGLAPLLLALAVLVPTVIWREPAPSAARPSSSAALRIAEPLEGQRVSTPTLDVVTEVSGATVVDGSETDVTPDTGHVHVYVDDRLMSMAYAPEQTIPIDWLSPGPHVLRVEFVAADHDAFDPPVEASVTFVKLTG
jgi:uncharacterized membrane protein